MEVGVWCGWVGGRELGGEAGILSVELKNTKFTFHVFEDFDHRFKMFKNW